MIHYVDIHVIVYNTYITVLVLRNQHLNSCGKLAKVGEWEFANYNYNNLSIYLSISVLPVEDSSHLHHNYILD